MNGHVHHLDVPRDTPLLYVLRNDLTLNGPKFGCGLGECGACTVLIDGVAGRSCVIPAGLVEGRAVVTLEGLGSAANPHPIQAAFIAAQAAQCGFCLNGMIMQSHALLLRNPAPTDVQIREELRYNLCRCGAHYEILQAVRAAAAALAPRGFAPNPSRGQPSSAHLSVRGEGDDDPLPGAGQSPAKAPA